MDRYLRRSNQHHNQEEFEKMLMLQIKSLKTGKNLTPAALQAIMASAGAVPGWKKGRR